MADRKVTELPYATALGASDVFYLVQPSGMKQIRGNTVIYAAVSTTHTGNIAFSAEETVAENDGVIKGTIPVTKVTGGPLFSIRNMTISSAPTANFIKYIVMANSSGGNVILSGLAGNAVVTFSKVGHSVALFYTSNAWYVTGGTAAVQL